MIVACDWCGAWSGCDKCDDPAVYRKMNSGELDNPMGTEQGGHIHACSPAHLLYRKDAEFATSIEGVEPVEIRLMLNTLSGVRWNIALAALTDTRKTATA
jgi:hypothetical protein